MGLSFLSLLYLQISYIEKMVKMRNEQFDESVKRGLMAASKEVESAEVARWLREDISEAEKRAWELTEQGQALVQTQRRRMVPSIRPWNFRRSQISRQSCRER